MTTTTTSTSNLSKILVICTVHLNDSTFDEKRGEYGSFSLQTLIPMSAPQEVQYMKILHDPGSDPSSDLFLVELTSACPSVVV